MSKRAEEAALKRFPEEMTRIPYQDLIEAFGGKEYVDFNSMPRGYFQLGYEQAEKDLGWISVKDRLPEESGFYITCVNQAGVAQCVGITLFNGKYWEDDDDSEERVDYWMPIPKLPKEEEK